MECETAAVICDVDGTLVTSNAVHYYLFLVRKTFSNGERLRRKVFAYLKIPYWLALDRVNRRLFNENFYRSYAGLPTGSKAEIANDCFREVFQKHFLLPVVERLRRHQAQGSRIILVSGSLDFLIEPLARYLHADASLCTQLGEDENSFTGKLSAPPMIGEEKAERLKKYSLQTGLDLSRCHAYADSLSDLAILNSVGKATVVNPNSKLKREALRKGWEIMNVKGAEIL